MMKHHLTFGLAIAKSRFILAGLRVLGLWAIVSICVHPLPHSDSDRPLFKTAEVAPAVAEVFSRACANCHSDRTRWPWYSQVAPVSWLVESDVKRAREHMNLSRWEALSPADQRLLLSAISTVIENREMPPSQYLYLHPEAKLSADAIVEVIEWTRAERRRLRRLATGGNTQQSGNILRAAPVSMNDR